MDMGRPAVMVNSPELIREVSDDTLFPKLPAFYDPSKSVMGNGIVAASGEHWKMLRNIINPLFYHNQLKQFSKYMTEGAGELISFLRTKDGQEVNCNEVLSESTLAIFIDSALSRSDFNPNWTAKHLEKSASLLMFFALTEFIFGSTLNSFFPWTRVLISTRQVILDKVAVICERVRNSPPQDEGASLVEMLVSLKENGKQILSDVEIADQAMTFLFAGYDTTKSAMCWALYFLCQNRHELEKIQNEVDRVLNGRTATFDDISNLPKVKNAIMEALRLRPAAPGIERFAPTDVELGGYFIPKGTTIYMNWHASHTDPTLWENPEAFYPDRFDNNTGYIKNFFAFSYGARNCVGQKFAIYEAVIVMSSLLQQFDIQMGSGKVQPLIHIAQDPDGFMCKFIPRR